MKIKLIQTIGLSGFLAVSAAAQTGGAFTIAKSVIASGGGTSSGGAFTVEGTAGQPAAGNVLGGQFLVSGGFVTQVFAPTAATVSVSGRVLTPDGRGLRNAIVVLTDANGSTLTARTSAFGYYRLEEVEVGQTYILDVRSKRYGFSTQVVSVTEEMNELNFIAQW